MSLLLAHSPLDSSGITLHYYEKQSAPEHAQVHQHPCYAVQVGIYDANYFSRLFKKTVGRPPSYYKSIPRETP